MSSASGTHPALALAKRMVAVAPDKLRAIQDEGLRLAPLIGRSEITRHEAAVCLIESASAFGLCRTAREREIVEHVIRMALSGQPAGRRVQQDWRVG